MVEDEYTLDNFGSNRQPIPLEFIFYDEIDEKIDLYHYMVLVDKYPDEIISIKNITTSFEDRIRNPIYR